MKDLARQDFGRSCEWCQPAFPQAKFCSVGKGSLLKIHSSAKHLSHFVCKFTMVDFTTQSCVGHSHVNPQHALKTQRSHLHFAIRFKVMQMLMKISQAPSKNMASLDGAEAEPPRLERSSEDLVIIHAAMMVTTSSSPYMQEKN